MQLSKEETMTNKDIEKKINKALKLGGKKRKYQFKNGIVFKKNSDYLVILSGCVSNNKYNYWIGIKRYLSDDYFWDILNMQSNKTEPESLRVIGAFSAPKIILKFDSLNIDEDFDKLVNELYDEFDMIIESFIDKNKYIDYVCNHKITSSNEILLLYFLEQGDYEKALNIAINQQKLGNRGGFENEGKTFYQWAIEYIKKIIKGGKGDNNNDS